MEIKDAVAVVTGGASGLGLATTKRLLDRGASVVVIDLRGGDAVAELGDRAQFVETNVTDPDAVTAALDAAEKMGPLRINVNCAGIGNAAKTLGKDGPFPLDAFKKVVEVNLIGAYRTVRACLPALTERRGYSLTVASIAAAAHPPGMASYAASKAGVEAFNNALRQEIHHLGVEIGVAYFPWLETDLVSGAEEHPAFAFFRSQLTPPFNKTYPVEIAAQALALGLKRRSKRVAAPGWVRGALLARGVIDQIAERSARQWGAELDRMYQQELEEQGEAAARPVGAGGEAAARATEAQRS